MCARVVGVHREEECRSVDDNAAAERRRICTRIFFAAAKKRSLVARYVNLYKFIWTINTATGAREIPVRLVRV